ncbi:hypothetical protein [Halobacillus litoralis]|uniref:Uncharacterized protein n=1 Tax=Halobacillus litoralis TaxID=45668 RepID=A0A410MCL6_9BACI|nr:hypothetical protein [Halobacillus litoralis]QAS52418.1 hypothetical protein HLI_09310 [Halobacillus litoralis]
MSNGQSSAPAATEAEKKVEKEIEIQKEIYQVCKKHNLTFQEAQYLLQDLAERIPTVSMNQKISE